MSRETGLLLLQEARRILFSAQRVEQCSGVFKGKLVTGSYETKPGLFLVDGFAARTWIRYMYVKTAS